VTGILGDTLEFFFQGLDACEVSATLADGSTRTFRAYFDAPYAEHALGDGFSLESAGYLLTCKTADTAGFQRDETVVEVDGRSFVVAAVRPGGAGLAEVELIDPDEVSEVRV